MAKITASLAVSSNGQSLLTMYELILIFVCLALAADAWKM